MSNKQNRKLRQALRSANDLPIVREAGVQVNHARRIKQMLKTNDINIGMALGQYEEKLRKQEKQSKRLK